MRDVDPDLNPDDVTDRVAVGGRGRYQAGAVLGGRYQIHEFLGRNAVGEQYRAVELKADRPVALRVLSSGALEDAQAAQRLRLEVDHAKTLSHKNIATIYGMGIEGDAYFLATEFVDGQHLRELLDQKHNNQKFFSLKGAYNVVAHICNALSYAHQSLFHGALSPSTVVVNKAGRVKVLDFGVARALPALVQFQAHLASGDTACMAPELAQAPETADRRADIYSVGVILFELLTGRALTEGFELPSVVRPELPKALDQVVERCLRPSPDERFLSADELKQALFIAVEQAQSAAHPAPGVSIVERAMTASAPMLPAVEPSAAAGAAPRAAAGPPGAPPRSPGARPGPPPLRRPPGPPPNANSAMPKDPLPWPTGPNAATQPPAPPGAHDPAPLYRPGVTSAAYSGPVYSGPPIDEAEEKWLIQKNKLDFGPFSMAEVKRQIERGEIEGQNVLIDNDTGKREAIKDHAYLARFYVDASLRREERRRIDADHALARKERSRSRSLVLVLGLLTAGVIAGVYVFIHFKKQETIVKVIEVPKTGDTDLERILKGLNFEFPAPKIRPRSKPGKGGGKGGRGSGAEDFDDPTHLGDVTQEGGEEQLTPQQIQTVMNAKGKSLAICIAQERRQNAGINAVELEFIVHGNGQVTAVRVNGQKNTPVANCMFQKMQRISFPKYNGPKTIAGFTWNIK